MNRKNEHISPIGVRVDENFADLLLCNAKVLDECHNLGFPLRAPYLSNCEQVVLQAIHRVFPPDWVWGFEIYVAGPVNLSMYCIEDHLPYSRVTIPISGNLRDARRVCYEIFDALNGVA